MLRSGRIVGEPTAVMAHGLRDASNWWEQINESRDWQDRIFHILAALYGIVGIVALIQLVRIQLRVPEYGWTTQKVFHFLNFLVNGVRSLVFVFRREVQKLQPEIVQHILLDMPSLAFFTTYALLVLFWAEIYYQARAVSTDGLRPSFYTINAVVYAIQIALWLILWWKPIRTVVILSKMFFAGIIPMTGYIFVKLDGLYLQLIICPDTYLAGVSLFAALGFLLYGGRLFLMLQRFPVESKGRRKKLVLLCALSCPVFPSPPSCLNLSLCLYLSLSHTNTLRICQILFPFAHMQMHNLNSKYSSLPDLLDSWAESI